MEIKKAEKKLLQQIKYINDLERKLEDKETLETIATNNFLKRTLGNDYSETMEDSNYAEKYEDLIVTRYLQAFPGKEEMDGEKRLFIADKLYNTPVGLEIIPRCSDLKYSSFGSYSRAGIDTDYSGNILCDGCRDVEILLKRIIGPYGFGGEGSENLVKSHDGLYWLNKEEINNLVLKEDIENIKESTRKNIEIAKENKKNLESQLNKEGFYLINRE